MSKYSERYYKRHFEQYREWENLIGAHIVQTINPKSILDLGCGVGSYLEGALSAGCKDILGIELNFDSAKKYFSDEIKEYITFGDITSDLGLKRKFDCVISFEVAEHIYPDKSDDFINNLTKLSDRYIIFTAAPPGQVGTNHINLREKTFWINKIVASGFQQRHDLIDNFSKKWAEFKAGWYIMRNLMVFENV